MKPSRILTLVLLCAYSVTQVLFPTRLEANFWEERQKTTAVEKHETQLAMTPAALPSVAPFVSALTSQQSLPQLRNKVPASFQNILSAIPYKHARIQDAYIHPGDKSAPILLLQDIHLNPEAQKNAAAVLESLIKNDRLTLVGVEGAFDVFDFKDLRAFPNKKATREAMQALMNENFLATPSFAGIVSEKQPPQFVGVDDKEHYQANVDAYIRTRATLARVEENLSEQNGILEAAKKKGIRARTHQVGRTARGLSCRNNLARHISRGP